MDHVNESCATNLKTIEVGNTTENIMITEPKIQNKNIKVNVTPDIVNTPSYDNECQDISENNCDAAKTTNHNQTKSKNKSFFQNLISVTFIIILTLILATNIASASTLPKTPTKVNSSTNSPMFSKIITEKITDLPINKLLTEGTKCMGNLIELIPNKNFCNHNQTMGKCHRDTLKTIEEIGKVATNWLKISEKLNKICKNPNYSEQEEIKTNVTKENEKIINSYKNTKNMKNEARKIQIKATFIKELLKEKNIVKNEARKIQIKANSKKEIPKERKIVKIDVSEKGNLKYSMSKLQDNIIKKLLP